MTHLLAALAAAPAATPDFITGGTALVDALKLLLIALAAVAAFAFLISCFRESRGAWLPVASGIILAAIFLFFIGNSGVLDPIIQATINRFW